MAVGDIVLGSNQYGKAENRVVRIVRDTPVHRIIDLNVTSQLRGDFSACHYEGDNSHVVATDTQKNTVYAYAKEVGVKSPEDFLIALGRHFVGDFEWVTGGRWEAEEYAWERIVVDGKAHDHSFVRAGKFVRTTVVQMAGDTTWVVSGIKDCVVLKSTGSEFHGFPRDKYTTLVETDDRILATSVTARWRYLPDAVAAGIDFNAAYDAIGAAMLSAFATTHSLALQQSLYEMGRAAVEACDGVAEIRFAMPNKHHFLSDLSPFGLKNPNEVFHAADRPYGLIEGTVVRDGVTPAPEAWTDVPSFV